MPEYTPPSNDAVDFALESYSPPNSDAVDFELGGGAVTGTGEGTETYPIDTESDWQAGTFTDVVTAGSGAIQLADAAGTVTFDYSLDTQTATGSIVSSASATIHDADSGTTLASDNVEGDTDRNGSFDIDIGTHDSLYFEASAEANDDGSASASISGPAQIGESDSTLVSVSVGQNDSASDSRTETYTYESTGSWTSLYWDFTNTTTATKLSWSGVTIPNAGDDITVTVENSDGTNTYSESVTAGSGEVLFEIAPDERYRVVVNVSTADDDTTPELGSLTLETHTSTGDTLQVDAVNGVDVDLSWGGVSVADGYQVLRAEASGVDPGDYTPLGTTTNTTFTDSTGDAGVEYYYRVRAQYEGE
jgi:hypothetical protein